MDLYDSKKASLDSGLGSDTDAQLVKVWREKEELERRLSSLLEQQKGSRTPSTCKPDQPTTKTPANIVHGIQETLQSLVVQLETFGSKFDALTARVDEMEQRIQELQGTRQTVTLLQNNLVAKSMDLSDMVSRLEVVEKAQRGTLTLSDLIKRKKLSEQPTTTPPVVEKKAAPRKLSFPLARSTLEEPRPVFSKKVRTLEEKPLRKTSVPTRRIELASRSTPSNGQGTLRGVSSWSSFTAPRVRFAMDVDSPADEKVVAFFYHNSASPSGLSFELGEQLEVTGRIGEDFSMARNCNGKTGFIPNKLVKRVGPLESSPWYHGHIGEEEANARLEPAAAGDFLVRTTFGGQNVIVLKGMERGRIHQIPVNETNGKIEFGGMSFSNLPCMVAYYMYSKVTIVYGECLRRPLPK